MKIVTFGEIMGRLNPAGFLRLSQALPGSLDVTFAGAEANVAASLSTLGADAAFVTALPDNALTDACLASLRALGIDTRGIVRRDLGRLGLYFVETGANQRASQVVYDRAGSTISLSEPDTYNWEANLVGAGWFHTTGITPAISESAAKSTIAAARAAKESGCRVSCDLNFRKKLWRWDGSNEPNALAQRTMSELLPYVDVVIANEEDCDTVLGIRASGTDVDSGHLSVDRYPEVAAEVVRRFPGVSTVAITLRESLSASHNNWGAMLYSDGVAHFAPLQGDQYAPYEIRNIVDRVGGGDAFAAGLIFASTSEKYSHPADAVSFAVASSCLAHSIIGDFNFSTLPEVEALMGGSASGRVVR